MDIPNKSALAGKILLASIAIISIITITGCSTPQPVATTSATQITPPITTTSITTFSTTTPPITTSQTPTQTPSPTPEESSWPTAIYTPEATQYIPNKTEKELFQFMLAMINNDRVKNNLPEVELNFNAAAQEHARDMLKNHYLAHWGTDGKKPYMRYTDAGGLNYESENSAYSSSSGAIDIKQELQALENAMLYDDAASNWSHRDNILNKWHQKVNLGIAYDTNTVALVQQFEGDYVEFYQPPTLTGNILTLSGRITQPGLMLNNIAITFDELPQPLTGEQLTNGPYHSYGLGQILGQVFPPAPEGTQYMNLPANSIIGSQGSFEQDGRFRIKADISQFLATGPGVYTIALVATMNGEIRNFTNYSITVEK